MLKVGEGDGDKDIGKGTVDDDCELMLEVLEVVDVVDALVLSGVPVPAVAVSELVGVVGGEVCWVSVGVDDEVSLDVGVMERIDPGREIEIGGRVREEESGGGGAKVGIARRAGADIAEGTANMSQCWRDVSLRLNVWSGNGAIEFHKCLGDIVTSGMDATKGLLDGTWSAKSNLRSRLGCSA